MRIGNAQFSLHAGLEIRIGKIDRLRKRYMRYHPYQDYKKKSFIERVKNSAKFYDERAAQREADLQISKTNIETEGALFRDLLGGLANLAGQNTVLGKVLAISQAILNTKVAITAALSAATLPARVAGVAFATAQCLSAIRDIKATPVPQVRIQSTTPFGRGGMIHGDSHDAPSGGTWILAEGGEAVINKKSMSIPWVRKQASLLNTIGGGVPFMRSGGLVPESGVNPFFNIERAIANAQSVLVIEDLDVAQRNRIKTESRARL